MSQHLNSGSKNSDGSRSVEEERKSETMRDKWSRTRR